MSSLHKSISWGYIFTSVCVALGQNGPINGLTCTGRKLKGCFGILAAETVHLTCAVTPAEPHMFQLGKLHFVLNSNEASSRVDKDHRHLSTHWIMWPVATELMLFLKKLNPSLPHPSPPGALSFRGTWTYDSSSRLGLSFSVCQGQSSQCTHTRSSTRRACLSEVQRSLKK